MQSPNRTKNTAASSGICFSREDKAVAWLGPAAYWRYVRSPRRGTNAVLPPENKFRPLGSHERKHVELLGAGFSPITARAGIYGLERGDKRYELSNHLGNVLAVVSDRRAKASCADTLVRGYWADVLSTSDYYPFGMGMVERGDDGGYRYGFNGKEKDGEGMGGGGSTYDYGFRIYNPGLGKFLSVDPLTTSFPYLTPFQFSSNSPISSVDLDGLETLNYRKLQLDKQKGKVLVEIYIRPYSKINDNNYKWLVIDVTNQDKGEYIELIQFPYAELNEIFRLPHNQHTINARDVFSNSYLLNEKTEFYSFVLLLSDLANVDVVIKEYTANNIYNEDDPNNPGAAFRRIVLWVSDDAALPPPPPVVGQSYNISPKRGRLDDPGNKNEIMTQVDDLIAQTTNSMRKDFNIDSQQITHVNLDIDESIMSIYGSEVNSKLKKAFPNANISITERPTEGGTEGYPATLTISK